MTDWDLYIITLFKIQCNLIKYKVGYRDLKEERNKNDKTSQRCKKKTCD
jgi:hypothetical protein